MHEQFQMVAPYTYIDFVTGPRQPVRRTEDLGNLLIDYAEDGTVLGIELIVPGKMCGCWTEEGGESE